MGAISTAMLCGRKPILVSLAGMDGSGKTTMLYKYKLGFDKTVTAIHTIGFNAEKITYKNYSFHVTDFGGGDKVQPILGRIFKDNSVLIFVVDSANLDHIEYARDRLMDFVSTNEAEHLLLLVFANKQDLTNVLSVTEIIEQLRLNTVECQWHVQPCTALTGEGVYEGFEWVCKNLP